MQSLHIYHIIYANFSWRLNINNEHILTNIIYIYTHTFINCMFDLWGFPGGSDGKESACNAGDLGSVPGGGHGNPLQCLAWRIPMGRGPAGVLTPLVPKPLAEAQCSSLELTSLLNNLCFGWFVCWYKFSPWSSSFFPHTLCLVL